MQLAEDCSVQIFGYGSLVWRPAFPYSFKSFGYIKGWRRRFWQGSIDHRGVPESPGRVVTLVPDDESFPTNEKYAGEEPIVWGVVYTLPSDSAASTLEYLDYREKNGYIRTQVDVYGIQGKDEPIIRGAILYAAGAENEHFLGPAPCDEICRTIISSVGPSGPNIEYLQQLVLALRSAGVYDHHCEELHACIEKITGNPSPN